MAREPHVIARADELEIRRPRKAPKPEEGPQPKPRPPGLPPPPPEPAKRRPGQR